MSRSAPGRGFAGRISTRLTLGAALLVSLAGLVSIERLFAPKAELWPRWQAHDPGPTETVDHSVWQRILGTYLAPGADGVNRFAYASVGPADNQALDGYIARLKRYARPELAKALEAVTDIEDYEYDWALNEPTQR